MRLFGLNHKGAALTISLWLVAGGAMLHADWSDNFDGGLQQNWVFQGVNLVTGMPSATFSAGSVDDVLEVADSSTILAGGVNVGFGVVPTEVFTDVLVSGTLNATNDFFTSPTLTLLARADPTNSTYYAAEVKFDSAELIIFRGDGLTDQTNLETMTLTQLDPDSDVYVEFSLEGDQLTATAFDMAGGTMWGSVTATDSTYAGGVSGFLAFDSLGGPLAATYDDIASRAIVSATLDCDSDGDADCDLTDIDAMYAAFGSSTPAKFDFDGSGTIGEGDIDGWLAAASVPENTALLDPSDELVKGDLDFNGDVTSMDLGAMLNNFGATSGVNWGDGDLNGDDQVNSSDLGLLLNRFGFTSATSASSVSSVPEPEGLPVGMLLVGMFGLLRGRSARRR